MEKTTEQMIAERAKDLLKNETLFSKVLDHVESGKTEELTRMLGPEYNHIIQTAYETTVNYD